MCDIILGIFLGMKVGDMAAEKGHSKALWWILFCVGWFFGEVCGIIVGVILVGGQERFLIIIPGFIGMILGGGVVALIVGILPENEGDRRWDHLGRPIVRDYDYSRPRRRRRPARDLDIDDDYQEKFSDRPRRRPRYDEEEEEDRPRRRRRREEDDE